MTPRTPRTAAGRALLALPMQPWENHAHPSLDLTDDILAIEEQAARDALADAARRVAKMPVVSVIVGGKPSVEGLVRAAVLAILSGDASEPCGWDTRRGDGPIGGPCVLPPLHDGPHAAERRRSLAASPSGDRPQDPCCYSIHEFENVCPRTGQNFTWNAPPQSEPSEPGSLRTALRSIRDDPARPGKGVNGWAVVQRFRDRAAAALSTEGVTR